MMADIVLEAEKNTKALVEHIFEYVDGNKLSYNDYVRGKEKLTAILNLCVIMVFIDNKILDVVGKIESPEKIERCQFELAYAIVASYNRQDAIRYIEDIYYVDNYDFLPGLANMVFDNSNYCAEILKTWRASKIDECVVDYLDYIECIANFECQIDIPVTRYKSKKTFADIKQATEDLALIFSEIKNNKYADEIINELKDYPRGTCPEDYGLKDFWEEICIQVQDEESIDWEMYSDIVDDIISSKIDELPYFEILRLWIYGTTVYEFDETDLENDLDDDSYYNILNCVKGVMRKLVMNEASNYESETLMNAIEKRELDI